MPRRLMLALGMAVLAAHAPAPAAPDALADLEQRLARSGVDAVNTHLSAQWTRAMVPLNRQTAACERRAVSLTVRLSRGREAKAAGAHGEALRAAAGRCAAYVLALLSPDEVLRVCTSLSSWGPAQTARELRRRIADIDADEALRTSARGKSCRATYHHELYNTRVVVKRAAPAARPASS